MVDKLAEYAFLSWINIVTYVFNSSILNNDGSVIIPKSIVERVTRLAHSEFNELTDSERVQFIVEAKNIINTIEDYVRTGK